MSVCLSVSLQFWNVMRRIENKYRRNEQKPLWNFHSQPTFRKGKSPSYTCYSPHLPSFSLFLEISGIIAPGRAPWLPCRRGLRPWNLIAMLIITSSDFGCGPQGWEWHRHRLCGCTGRPLTLCATHGKDGEEAELVSH